MNKGWDKSGVAFDPDTWRAVLRVLKPGGYLLAFGGTRTYHRMACAIEDAGFEIRDCVMWLYGSGFPKSLDVSKAINKLLEKGSASPGANELVSAEWSGWGTALKPAYEPIIVARKPFEGTVAANVLKYGCGGINIDGCRIETNETLGQNNHARTEGTSYVVQKEDKYIDNSTGKGRWPANVILDEEAGAVLDAQTGVLTSGKAASGGHRNKAASSMMHSSNNDGYTGHLYGDSGGASRFFYCAKTSKKERDLGCENLLQRSAGEMVERDEDSAGIENPRAGAGRTGGARNHHPTVKPIALMRYLCRLVCPPGGTVLDPFMGSGSTGCAAIQEGFSFIGIEKEAEYLTIAEARIKASEGGK